MIIQGTGAGGALLHCWEMKLFGGEIYYGNKNFTGDFGAWAAFYLEIYTGQKSILCPAGCPI